MRSKVNPMTRVCPNEIKGTCVSGMPAPAKFAARAMVQTVETAAPKTLNHLAYGRGNRATSTEATIGAAIATKPRRDRLTANDIVSPFSYTPTTTKTNARTAMPTTAQV